MIIAICIAIGVALLVRHYAQANVNDEAEIFVVQEQFDPDAPGNQLIEAVRVGDAERVDELLQAGADPNWVWEGSGPPLVTAVLVGEINMIEPLLEHGADPAVQDASGRTAYYYSSEFYADNPGLNERLRPKLKKEAA